MMSPGDGYGANNGFYGSSSSDIWARRVHQQMQQPFGGPGGASPAGVGGVGRGARTGGGDDWVPEWNAPRRGGSVGDDFDGGARPPGWVPPPRREDYTQRPSPSQSPAGDDLPRPASRRRARSKTRYWSDDGGFSGQPL